MSPFSSRLLGFLCLCLAANHALAKKWFLTDLTLRFMGPSGLPDPIWPDSARFNSSINFSVEREKKTGDPTVASCVGNWREGEGKEMQGWNWCAVDGSDEQIHWRIAPGSFKRETNFRLDMLYSNSDSTAEGNNLQVDTASLVITNEPDYDVAYLVCVTGTPLAGMNCNTRGPAPSPPKRIRMHSDDNSATTIPIKDFFVQSLVANPYAALENQTCMQNIIIGVAKPEQVECSLAWPCSQGEPYSAQEYKCQSDDFSFSMKPHRGESVFAGFRLGLKKTQPVNLSGVKLIVETKGDIDLRLGENMVYDCGPDGHDRCVTKIKGPYAVLVNSFGVANQ